MPLPTPRGELSAALIEALTRPPGDRPLPEVAASLPEAAASLPEAAAPAARDQLASLADEDAQLALYCCYELHYRGIAGVDDAWEWQPGLLGLRSALERALETALRHAVPFDPPGLTGDKVVEVLHELTAPTPRPALAGYLARTATVAQYRELLILRSAYHLKEADPHTWAIPRLHGEPKAALVEIQADEYGGGRPEWMHSALFAQAMRALGLDDRYGQHLDAIPAAVLASVNAMSLFGLHRRLRGAAAGHLAAFEMTSTRPNVLAAAGLRRLRAPEQALAYFTEHVEADAVHEQLAARHLAGGLARQQPMLTGDILFGARACLLLDDLVADHVVGAWRAGRSALRNASGPPSPGGSVPAQPAPAQPVPQTAGLALHG